MRKDRNGPLIARQHGVITTAQLGLSPAAITRRVQDGRLHRKYRGAYAVGHPALSREGEWMAAVLACGHGAALASLSAAVLWEITRIRPDGIDVIAPTQRRTQPGLHVRRSPGLDPRDVTVHDRIPVTTVARTLVDLTDVLTAEQLANVIHEAAFRRRFSVAATRAAMARASGRRLRVLEKALKLHESGSAGTKSSLEDRFLRLVRAAGLPEPATNTDVRGYEVDFSWPGLCVEIDGGGHSRRRTKTEDRARDAALRAGGIEVVRFTDDEIHERPEAVIAALRELAA